MVGVTKQMEHSLIAGWIYFEDGSAARRSSTGTGRQVSTRGRRAKEITGSIPDQTSHGILALPLLVGETVEHGFVTGWAHLVDGAEKGNAAAGCAAVEIANRISDYARNWKAAIISMSEVVENCQLTGRVQLEEESATERPAAGGTKGFSPSSLQERVSEC